MRILVVSDLHYDLKQFDWLKQRADAFDLIVVAGDMLELSSMVDRRAQIVVVRAYLEQLSALTRVVVCSGNHDLIGPGADGENTAEWMTSVGRLGILSDWASRVYDRLTITSCAWWDGPLTRAELGQQLADTARGVEGDWVWIYHAPPDGSATAWGGQRFFGDDALTEWIELYRPRMVISGHVHQAPFIPQGAWVDRVGETLVFNTGRQPGPEPAHIAFDLEDGLAHWVSIEGAETLDLQDRQARPQPMTEWPEILRV